MRVSIPLMAVLASLMATPPVLARTAKAPQMPGSSMAHVVVPPPL